MGNFDTLIVEGDTQVRHRLRTACSPVALFGAFHNAKDIANGLELLKGEVNIDIIFISQSYSLNEVSSFIATAKKTAQGEKFAFIALTKMGEGSITSAAQGMLVGIDAYLPQPYSVDALTEITQLAAKMREIYAETKVRLSITRIVEEVIGQLRVTSFFLCEGDPQRNERFQKQFREASAVLRTLSSDQKKVYYDVISELLDKEAPRPEIPDALNYKGKSERIRKMLEIKIIELLKNQVAPDNLQGASSTV